MLECKPYISVCIPTYNRPQQLAKALETIDSKCINEVEIVVSDNHTDDFEAVNAVIENYKKNHKYKLAYFRNDENIGYDRNIRSIISKASGKWIMLLSDDDFLIEGALDREIEYLKKSEDKNIGYVLRRFQSVNEEGKTEEFRYYDGEMIWPCGEKTIIELFRKSVFLSGFTFKRECFNDFQCSDYDGTLLFQLYVMANVCLNNPAAYCDIPISKNVEGGIPLFGDSDVEKGLYESGQNKIEGSLRFLSQVKRLTETFDRKYNTNVTSGVMKDYSKYSFGYLQEHRNDGINGFRRYAKEIKKLGLGESKLFYVYYYALMILGRKNCYALIRAIKRIHGSTPRL